MRPGRCSVLSQLLLTTLLSATSARPLTVIFCPLLLIIFIPLLPGLIVLSLDREGGLTIGFPLIFNCLYSLQFDVEVSLSIGKQYRDVSWIHSLAGLDMDPEISLWHLPSERIAVSGSRSVEDAHPNADSAYILIECWENEISVCYPGRRIVIVWHIVLCQSFLGSMFS